MNNNFTVHKRDHTGKIVLSYQGEVIGRGETWVCIQARFEQSTRDLGYMVLKHGDMFTEWFYSDRWYNVFQIHDVDDNRLKGYYCNITRPAEISEAEVASDDLALDLFVHPNGMTQLLDEDEYESLQLPSHIQQTIRQTLAELKQLVAAKKGPFAALHSNR